MTVSNKHIHVFLVESNHVLRSAISTYLKKHRDIILCNVEFLKEILDETREMKPEVIIMDPISQDLDVFEPLDVIRRKFPNASTIVMNTKLTQSDVVQYVRSGVCGFILREAPFEDYLRTIRYVASGTKVVPPLLMGSLFTQISVTGLPGNGRQPMDSVRLTGREREIVGFIAGGLSNKEIAQKLCISTSTVKIHVHAILEKLNLHTRLQIAHFVHLSPLK